MVIADMRDIWYVTPVKRSFTSHKAVTTHRLRTTVLPGLSLVFLGSLSSALDAVIPTQRGYGCFRELFVLGVMPVAS